MITKNDLKNAPKVAVGVSWKDKGKTKSKWITLYYTTPEVAIKVVMDAIEKFSGLPEMVWDEATKGKKI